MKLCNFEGQAMKSGVCVTHGAKWRHKQCCHEGCTKQARKGGACVTHGLKGNDVAMRGVLTRLFREEFVTGMATRHHSLHKRINIYIFICSNETLSYTSSYLIMPTPIKVFTAYVTIIIISQPTESSLFFYT